jgi:hypothetical protein
MTIYDWIALSIAAATLTVIVVTFWRMSTH